jgi:hypothetical protein
VQEAIEHLGRGFLSHRSNGKLRERLRSGALPTQEFYREILRLVYRLLFLFVAEDRDALHPRDIPVEARETYRDFYSTHRLRQLAEEIRGTAHADLFASLRMVMLLLGSLGAPELGLPVLGSYLWSDETLPDLMRSDLSNADLLEAVRALGFTRRGKDLWRVDYRNLGSEELGSVYESLLELHPEVDAEAGHFSLSMAAGHERKTTGSYYTPHALVQSLLETALDPVLEEAAKGPNPEAAILALTVCDPATGSGHFLIAAAHRIARRLASVRTGDEEPAPEAMHKALRDVIGRCLYGVDVNPMAVELCKVSLWMEALEPGKPLSFLDAHIQCGNSLLGTTPDLMAKGIPEEAFGAIEGDDKKVCTALRKRNRAEREGLGPLFAEHDTELQLHLEQAVHAMDEIPDERLEDIQRKEILFRQIEAAEEYREAKLVADAWCAAFTIRKYLREPGVERTAVGVTQHHLYDIVAGTVSAVDQPIISEIQQLAESYRFFHWHLAFPEVFARGGFDVVLGNPPWDTLSPDAKEFFSTYEPRIRHEDKEGQTRIIERLLKDHSIAAGWEENRRSIFASVHFMKSSGRYRLFAEGNLGKGDFNVFRMFVETALAMTREGGYTAQLVPEGLYNGANSTAIRLELFSRSTLSSLLGFENKREVWFEGIDTRMKFCLYVACRGGHTTNFRAAFNITSSQRLLEVQGGRSLQIPVDIVRQFSPEALAIMEFNDQREIDIAAKMYAKWPKFGDANAGPPMRTYMCELHMGNDRDLFGSDPSGFPLYEGRMVDQFDHRAKGYRSGRGRSAVWEELPFGGSGKSIQPQWRISLSEVPEKVHDRLNRYRIGFCDVTSPTNERSLIAALLPPSVVSGHKVPTFVFDGGWDWAYMLWLAVANSCVIDFIARKKVALSMSYTVLDTIPFPRLAPDHPLARRLVPLALRLTCCGTEMLAYWNARAAEGWCDPVTEGVLPPGVEDEEQRLVLKAEIDDIVARDVYGLNVAEMEYILDSFSTWRKREEDRFGEFRSRRLILEKMDAGD